MSHQASELQLVSRPTQDLIEAVVKAAWGNDGGAIEDQAHVSMEAIEGGAMIESEVFRQFPLHVVVMGWKRSSAYRQAMLPVFDALCALSSQGALDRALDLTTITPDNRQIALLAKRLRTRGARVGDEALRGIQNRLASDGSAKNDGACAKMVAELQQWGWTPSDSTMCRAFLGVVIESKATQTLDAFVSIYENADIGLPTRAGRDGYSPLCLIYKEQGSLKDHQQKAIDRYNDMTERLLHSGLVAWEPGAPVDWKQSASDWVIEAETEGHARRLARNTPQSTPDYSHAGRMRRI